MKKGREAAIFGLLAIGLLTAGALYFKAERGSRDGGKPQAHNESSEAADERGGDVTQMSDARIAAAGMSLEKAAPATLNEALILNGVLRENQENLVQVTPRFPGIVRSIQKRIGDNVRKDELLARIESNQSLTAYDLKAPIDGTVIDRQVSLGEYASEQKPAFTIADLSTVWVDLSVYSKDLQRVRVGDQVEIDLEDGKPPVTGQISYLSPVGSSETQSAIARAVVANPDGRLRPGLFVRGRVALSTRRAAIAVKATALQTLDNKSVVFVREGEKLEARRVTTGERDKNYVEILEGLSAGEIYVADNSFVVKAEIGKSEAEHE
jgi:cobalt-zinc-cadmium efflux system membrane fusion protein